MQRWSEIRVRQCSRDGWIRFCLIRSEVDGSSKPNGRVELVLCALPVGVSCAWLGPPMFEALRYASPLAFL